MSEFVSEREMGFTRAAFFKQLPRTLAEYEYSIDGDHINVELAEGSVDITVGPEGERRFTAVVAFPMLPVTLRFQDASDEARNGFLHRFESSYRKGLG